MCTHSLLVTLYLLFPSIILALQREADTYLCVWISETGSGTFGSVAMKTSFACACVDGGSSASPPSASRSDGRMLDPNLFGGVCLVVGLPCWTAGVPRWRIWLCGRQVEVRGGAGEPGPRRPPQRKSGGVVMKRDHVKPSDARPGLLFHHHLGK